MNRVFSWIEKHPVTTIATIAIAYWGLVVVMMGVAQ